jgi:hypothetical protein
MNEQQQPIKWAELTPGQRNALVAEKVFGRIIERAMTFGRLLMQKEDRPGLSEEIPPYTTSMDAAWLAVRKVNESIDGSYARYATFVDELEQLIGSDMFFDLFFCDKDGDHLTPERICIAALRTCGCKVEV